MTYWFLQHLRLIILLLLIQSTLSYTDDFDEELHQVIDAVRTKRWNHYMSPLHRVRRGLTPANTTSDHSLWSSLYGECHKKATFSCIKTGVFKYLDKNLENEGDIEVTDSLFFKRNDNKFVGVCENSDDEKERCEKYQAEKMKMFTGENEIDVDERILKDQNDTAADDDEEVEESERSLNGLYDVTDLLYDKGAQFLMTHDFELALPNMFFGGGAIKIEPKSFDENGGALVRLDFQPRQEEGRLHFSFIKKFFKKKLMHSFMALLLIIKMIKVKIMFLLPMIVGQSTAKKLLLKVLLFIIPGLAHLFKLCHTYHTNHAKYHHHHHLIKHHHHHIKVPVPVPVPVPAHDSHHDGGPYPAGPDSDYAGYAGPSDLTASHPPAVDEPGYDYPPAASSHHPVYNRHEFGSLQQYNDNEAYMSSWGLGSTNDPGVLDAKDQPAYNPYAINNYDNRIKKSPSTNKPNYYQPNSLTNGYQTIVQKPAASNPHTFTIGQPVGNVPAAYDAFYSPILQKIDNIFTQLGFHDEGCRERLVCSMYKTPHMFSPHSNLLSSELSRDPQDLQKPLVKNTAVVRFYRYVQAARDGQRQKDCLRLYSDCLVNTETG